MRHCILRSPRLRVADAEVTVQRGAVNSRRRQIESVLQQLPRLFVLLVAFKLLLPPARATVEVRGTGKDRMRKKQEGAGGYRKVVPWADSKTGVRGAPFALDIFTEHSFDLLH